MAKRVRAQRSTHRPGGQGPVRIGKEERATSTDRPTPDGSEVPVHAAAVTARASARAGRDVAAATDSRARSASQADTATGSRVSRARSRTRADSLPARAAAELVYVRDDLRRIGIVSLVIGAVLAAVWLLQVVIDPFGVY